MAVPYLNNAAVSSASYTDALTVVFPYAREAFTVNVFNQAVYYQLATVPATGQAGVPEWEFGEHYLTPSMSNFRDPTQEGLPPGRKYAGARFRKAGANDARITVA